MTHQLDDPETDRDRCGLIFLLPVSDGNDGDDARAGWGCGRGSLARPGADPNRRGGSTGWRRVPRSGSILSHHRTLHFLVYY